MIPGLLEDAPINDIWGNPTTLRPKSKVIEGTASLDTPLAQMIEVYNDMKYVVAFLLKVAIPPPGFIRFSAFSISPVVLFAMMATGCTIRCVGARTYCCQLGAVALFPSRSV